MVGSGTLGKRVLGIYLPLAFFIFFLLFPFYWMSLVSFKPTNDLFELQYNPFWLQTFTLENYLYLFQNTAFPLNEAAEMGGSPNVANGACRGVSLAFEVTCERIDVWSTDSTAQAPQRLGRGEVLL